MQPISIAPSIALFALLFSWSGTSLSSAEEGKAAIFVVDSSKESAELLDKNNSVPANREIHVYASGPKGSTVIVGAFGENGLHGNLIPIAFTQTTDTEAVRFPATGATEKLTVEAGTKNTELYVVVFPNENPTLKAVVNEVKQIEEASKKGATDLVMLFAIELKKKLANAIRESGAKEYREGFGESLADLLKEEPTAKAAVTRTGTNLDNPTESQPEAPTTQSSIPLSDLETNWTENSTSIAIGLVAPGGIVRTITSTP